MLCIPDNQNSELYIMAERYRELKASDGDKSLLELGALIEGENGMRFKTTGEFWDRYNSGRGMIETYRAYRIELELAASHPN